MPIGFHKECCFCSNEELKPTEPEPPDRLWALVCIRNFMCPHCFDVFRRPIRPAWTTLLVWLAAYVLSYFVLTDPQSLVQHQWPDQNAQVARQFVYAPLMHLDPRVHEQRLILETFRQAIEPLGQPESEVGQEPTPTQIATQPETRARL